MIEYSLYTLIGSPGGSDQSGQGASLAQQQIAEVVESLKEKSIGFQLCSSTLTQQNNNNNNNSAIDSNGSATAKGLEGGRQFRYFSNGVTVIDDLYILFFNTFEPADKHTHNLVNFQAAKVSYYSPASDIDCQMNAGMAKVNVSEFLLALGLQEVSVTNLKMDIFFFGHITVELYHVSPVQAMVIAKSLQHPFPTSFLKQQHFQWHKISSTLHQLNR
jgi:hypothetical protein